MAVNKADIEFIDGALNSACRYQDSVNGRFKIVRSLTSNNPSSIGLILISTELIKIRKEMEEMSYNIDQARKRTAKMAKEVG